MNLILKGISKKETILKLKNSGINQYTFDLRPRSLNFTQARNIEEIVKSTSEEIKFSILFENETEFLVKEVFKPFLDRSNITLEFSGVTPIKELDDYGLPFFWHYHDQQKISELSGVSNLKRIIFHQEDLEYLNGRGELYGFFQLFSDLFETVEFEIQLNWKSELILSALDAFNILILSYEIDSSVEISYQQPNVELIEHYILNLKSYLEGKNKELQD